MTTMYARSALVDWDDTTVGGWSNSSGGASNGTVPQSTDSVVFDANSGAARTIGGGVGNGKCLDLTTTGSNAMVLSTVDCYGHCNLSAMTSIANLYMRGASKNLTLGSCVITNVILVYAAASNMTLQSNLTLTGNNSYLYVEGSFIANGYNVSIGRLQIPSGSAGLNMGSGTWTVYGDASGASGNVWDVHSSATVVAGTSTIKITHLVGTKNFIGGGKTYYNLWHAGEDPLVLSGANTFNDILVGSWATLKLTSGVTQTCTTFRANGAGAPITISSTTPASAATLAKSGGGTVYIDYCSIRDITASPGSTFFARNSTNVSGNTNWTFVPNNSAFLAFF